MKRKDIINVLREAECDDACVCVFNLYDYDDKYKSICKATDPPCDPWTTDGCPFCKQIADLIEINEPKKADFRQLPFNDYRFECPRCKNGIEMFHEGEQTNFCPHCGQAVLF